MPNDQSLPVCGIVMPISATTECSDEHWRDVLAIISESVDSAGYAPNLVSNADDVGIIQKRIIQNLYDNPIVVCDVSTKNPNVMFELGIRLAFDKPTIIIKDDKTSYSFDTAPIEHLEYPRDLRFARIVDFKEDLAEKIKGTVDRASKDKDYTTFLKHFGTFKVPKLDKEEVTENKFILEELRQLREAVNSSLAQPRAKKGGINWPLNTFCLRETSEGAYESLYAELRSAAFPVLKGTRTGKNHYHIKFEPVAGLDRAAIDALARKHTANIRWLG